MPSLATITAFYSFTANTKARASQINGNFDAFRGHIIPISPNTQTSISNTYDLGSSDYSWKRLYAGDIKLGATSTSWSINDESSTGGGSLVFKKNDSEVVRFTDFIGQTTSAQKSQIGYSEGTSGSVVLTSTGYNLTGSTVTVTTIGRPVSLHFTCQNWNTLTGFVLVESSATGLSTNSTVTHSFYRNTTSSLVASVRNGILNFPNAITSSSHKITLAIANNIFVVDYSATAGLHNYFMQINFVQTSATASAVVNNYRLVAREFAL